ncbi:MAG: tetratricopeptide repeat protein [Spirochaetota bacterium]
MSPPIVIALLLAGIFVLGSVLYAISRGSNKTRRPRTRDKNALMREANKALAQNPKDAEALNTLAGIYYSEQEWEKAAKTYGVLMDLVATNPGLNEHEITLRHGLASMQIGDSQNAYKSLMLARRDHEDQFEINYNLGQLEFKRKNYERALHLLRAAHESRPDHLGTTKHLGQSYFRVKRFRDAISLLRRVGEQEPDDKETIFYLGQAYYEAGQSDQASRIFGHLRADPTYGPRASLMAGSIHLKARLYDEAEMDFQIGLRHENVPPEILLEIKYRLAATYTRKQQLDKALQVLQEIARVNPNYKDVSAQLERSRELAGNRNLQIFLMAPTSEFVGLCRRIVVNYFPRSKAKITDISVGRSEYTDILAEINTAKWEDVVLFRFVRSSSAVGELVLRDLHSRTKELHAGRGLCICAGSFSETAIAFVEARLIDLIDKEGLNKLLKRV